MKCSFASDRCDGEIRKESIAESGCDDPWRYAANIKFVGERSQSEEVRR